MDLNRPNLNFSGPEWLALEEWMKQELEKTYRRLSGLNTTDTEVRQNQGRASVLEQMLSFRTKQAVRVTAK